MFCMLCHIALGDAYGAGFEFAPAQEVRAYNDLSGYRQHPKHLGIAPGCYTDDTQMSLAVAEALLESPAPTQLDWAGHFVDVFRRDPRDGYAGRFYDFLQTVQSGQDLLERIRPHSDKSGAAMRALPIGYLPAPDAVLAVAAEQARVTHNTPEGVLSAQAVALTGHYFLYQLGPRQELASYVAERLGGCWSDWQGRVGLAGMDTARAVISALLRHDSMARLLRACVDYTGDVDTVAALALGAAWCSPEYRRDLPQVLWDKLEDGPYGKEYLMQVQVRLAARFPVGASR
jgi:ADP-ribosylglycohydrolase